MSNASGITNLPFHTIAVANADAIYDKELGGAMGKTVRKKPERDQVDGIVSIPQDLYD